VLPAPPPLQRVVRGERDVVVWVWWERVIRPDGFPGVLLVPAGSPEEEAGGARWIVNVSSRKRYCRTGIMIPVVHSDCRWFGLENRHDGEIECGNDRKTTHAHSIEPQVAPLA